MNAPAWIGPPGARIVDEDEEADVIYDYDEDDESDERYQLELDERD